VSEHPDATVAAIRQGGVDVTYQRYPGEGHAFSPAWADSTATTVAHFRQHL
jgi:dipeptidyl aminopeptidase/acylaminoacyl peptidase